MKEYAAKQPSPWVSVLPLAVLTLLLYVVIRCFGGDAINGGSQIALLSATSVWVMLAIALPVVGFSGMFAMLVGYRVPGWAAWIPPLLGTVMFFWGVFSIKPARRSCRPDGRTTGRTRRACRSAWRCV